MPKSLEELRAFAGKFHFPRIGPQLKRKLALGIPILPTSPERMRDFAEEMKAKQKAP